MTKCEFKVLKVFWQVSTMYQPELWFQRPRCALACVLMKRKKKESRLADGTIVLVPVRLGRIFVGRSSGLGYRKCAGKVTQHLWLSHKNPAYQYHEKKYLRCVSDLVGANKGFRIAFFRNGYL